MSGSKELHPPLQPGLDTAVSQFEGRWLQGERPPLEEFLPPPGPSRAAALVELVHAELELRLKAGQPARVEDYLPRFPELDQPAVVCALAAAEFHQRRRLEPQLSPDEYAARFPQVADEMARHLNGADASRPAVPTTRPRQPPRPAAGPAVPHVPGYEILGLLGKGGMGVVYKARQVALDRVVALKMLLHSGHADAEDLARFRTEAQAAARLQHPHIVAVYEIGSHAGLPFFSLEYVPGGGLDRLIAGTPRGAQESARIMLALARAVHHAHGQGVLHRDLKPANVLLAEDGTPKITDFGLAKRLDVPSGQTQTGQVMGTPSYMAPEQAQGKKDVGPAADVYALGAILYELLTGRPPFKGETVLETLEQVCGQDPVPPTRLNPKVPRDLETVCLKCLHKEPVRRYASAAALAEDLQRWLDGKPVLARPVGRAARLGRWCRRNPGVASLGGAVIVLVVAVVVGLVVGLLKVTGLNRDLEGLNRDLAGANVQLDTARQTAEGKREEADAKRAEAEQARQQTETVVSYLVAALRKPDPKRDGYKVTVAEVLAQAVAQLDKQPEMEPLTQAKVLDALGATYVGLGLYGKAIPLFERERSIREQHQGHDSPDTLLSMNHLAWAYWHAGRLQEALPLFEETLEVHKARLGPDHPATLTAMTNVAATYSGLERRKDAIRLYEETLKRERQRPEDRGTLVTMNNLANEYGWDGRWQDAIALHEETLELQKDKLGRDDPDTLKSMNCLAFAYGNAGRRREALPLFEETLKLQKARLPPDHPDTLTTMGNLAHAYDGLGRWEDAANLYEELAESQLRVEKYAAAEATLRYCLGAREYRLPDSWRRPNVQSLLGASLLGQKKYSAAEPWLLQGYDGLKAHEKDIPAPAKSSLTQAAARLVQLYEALGQPEKAEQWRARRDAARQAEPPDKK
jgi:eukaryotic-like serine/threonine-protein kinase